MPQLPFFVCGVRGGNLKMRIESIMRGAAQRPITVMTRFALVSAAIVVVAGPMVAGAVKTPAQQPAAITLPAQTTLPSFEVASVKRNPSGLGRSMIENVQPSGLWLLTNVPTRALIRTAYRVQDFQIVGAPDWVQTEHYDVVAKASGDLRPAGPGAPRAQFLMLRSLLIDRFKLKTHVETRPVDVYSLVVARSDGRLGPRLRPASAECTKELEAARELERAWRAGLIAPGPEPKRCNVKVGLSNGLMRITGGRSMSELAAELQQWTELKVVDRTGLRGDYEAELEFDFRATLSAANADPGKPSVFTAVQEQLGLRLRRSREPVDVLVIDAIEMPSEN